MPLSGAQSANPPAENSSDAIPAGDGVMLGADFDFQALAERLLALMKKEARLERERLGRHNPRVLEVRDD